MRKNVYFRKQVFVLLMWLIFAMDNKAVANWGHINICNKQHVENATSPFSVFLLLQRQRDFRQKFNGKAIPFFKTDIPRYAATLDDKMTVKCFSKFRIFLLTTWKLIVNFSDLYNIRYWHVIHSKLRLHKGNILSKLKTGRWKDILKM